MPEQYANNYASTLSGSYTSGSGSMSVTSATGLPTVNSGDTTHLTVFDASTKTFKLLIKVTAISGTTLTVVAETSDTNCSSGDIIRGSMISVEALDQMRKDLVQSGPYASLPSTTGQKAGNTYLCDDAPYKFRFNGSAWIPYLDGIGKVTLPPAAGWTAVGTQNTDYTYGYGYQDQNTGSGNNALILQRRAVPGSTPWTQRAIFGHELSSLAITPVANGNLGFCICVGDTGGKWISFFYDINISSGNPTVFLGVFKHSSSTSAAGSTYYSQSEIAGLATLKFPSHALFIQNDGTNLIFSVSFDGGNHKKQLTSHTITDFLASADYLAWGTYCILGNNTVPTVMLFDWTTT